MDPQAARRRLVRLMGAGLVDSLCLSVAWTVLMLQVVASYGLAAAGLCSAAMLIGVALSAPVASWMASLLSGRHLLRAAAAAEATLRVSVFLLLFTDAPVWVLALCISTMNVTAWTGYAGMRAEVAAVSSGPTALTWYGTIVASVEAAGVAVAAFLPARGGVSSDTVLLAVMAAYVLALVPTVIVAGDSSIAPGGRRVRRPHLRRGAASATTMGGTVLMFLASAPTLLAVALAAELHGREAVAPAAIAFTLGSLAAPALTRRIPEHRTEHLGLWIACALGMVVGWVLAPVHVAMMCVAQLSSGLFMTALEGLLDTSAARRHPGHVTGALARATAGRALGSAAGTALLPLLVVGISLEATTASISLVLLSALVLTTLWARTRDAADVPTPGAHAPSQSTLPVASQVG